VKKTRRTRSKNSVPVQVNRVLRVVQAKSTTSNSSSGSLIACDSGQWRLIDMQPLSGACKMRLFSSNQKTTGVS